MITKSTIVALGQLIHTGEADAGPLAAIPEGQSLGLWTSAPKGKSAVVTPALVELLSRFPDEHEVPTSKVASRPRCSLCLKSAL